MKKTRKKSAQCSAYPKRILGNGKTIEKNECQEKTNALVQERTSRKVKSEEKTSSTLVQTTLTRSTVLQETVQVKEEAVAANFKESDTLDYSNLLPDPEDPNFYCRSCKYRYSIRYTFRNHCIRRHKMDLPLTPKNHQLTLIAKFSNIVPDPNDPENNCCVCQKNFSYKSNFHRHLRTCHKMDINKPASNQIKHPHIVPDSNDPNNYCAACERKFVNRRSYHSHIGVVHNIIIKTGNNAKENNGILPNEDDPNAYCRVCNRTFSNKRCYRTHLQKIHLMVPKPGLTAIRAMNSHLTPDKDDPNNYCIVCEKSYSKRGYSIHLETMHGIKYTRMRKKHIIVTEDSDIVPDENDPNFYCCLCKIKYDTRTRYRNHLGYVHCMTLTPIDRSVNKKNCDVLPDKDDPNFYCRTCQRTFSARHIYRKHLRYTHDMDLVPLKKINPLSQRLTRITCPKCDNTFRCDKYNRHVCKKKTIEAPPKVVIPQEIIEKMKPDEDDPNFYCCVCQKHSINKRTFYSHLKVAHNMNVPDISYSPPPVTGPLPDIYDPNFYCSLCKKTLLKADNYYFHLRGVHRMKFTIPRKPYVIPYPELTPDQFNPDYNCVACARTYSNKNGFHAHLRHIHKMKLSGHLVHRGIKNPEIIPDGYNTDNYCSACERTYISRLVFRCHLRYIHDMEFLN